MLVVVLHGKQITRNDIFRIFGNQCDEVRAVFGKLDPERKKDLLRVNVVEIVIASNCAYRRRDRMSCLLPLPPTGLLGPVRLA